MNNYIYSEYSMKDRTKMLQNSCTKSHVKTYNRSLTDSEVENEKDRFASDAIELDRLKKELKAEQERLKAGITSVENLMAERLERIKSGQMETTGTLYGLPDHHKGMMRWYDSYGELINSTPLTPDEKQGRLFLGDDVPVEGKVEERPDNAEPGEQINDEGITDVEFEEVEAPEESTDPEVETTDEDEEYKQAVEELYNGDGESVDIPVQEPEEEKPAKKGSKRGKKNNDPL